MDSGGWHPSPLSSAGGTQGYRPPLLGHRYRYVFLGERGLSSVSRRSDGMRCTLRGDRRGRFSFDRGRDWQGGGSWKSGCAGGGMARANRSRARSTASPRNGRQAPRAAALLMASGRGTVSDNLCAVGGRNARKHAFLRPCAACRVDPGGLWLVGSDLGYSTNRFICLKDVG